MTRIDFYILPQGGEPDAAAQLREWFACRIAEKAYGQGHAVYLQAADQGEATRLDTLLWRFRAGSFVPHALVGDTTATPAVPPVLVAWDGALDGEAPLEALHAQGGEPEGAVLVTLAADVPLFFSHFARVIELVADDDAQRDAARARFRFYRDRGYELNTHEVAHEQLRAD